MADPTAPERRYADCSMVRTVTGTHCSTPPTRWVQVGCVHEHIKVGAACSKHVTMLEAGDSVIFCVPCKTGGESHICKVIARVITTEEKNRIAGISDA